MSKGLSYFFIMYDIYLYYTLYKYIYMLFQHILERMKDRKEFLIVGYLFGSLIAIKLARLLKAENFMGRLILIILI